MSIAQPKLSKTHDTRMVTVKQNCMGISALFWQYSLALYRLPGYKMLSAESGWRRRRDCCWQSRVQSTTTQTMTQMMTLTAVVQTTSSSSLLDNDEARRHAPSCDGKLNQHRQRCTNRGFRRFSEPGPLSSWEPQPKTRKEHEWNDTIIHSAHVISCSN